MARKKLQLRRFAQTDQEDVVLNYGSIRQMVRAADVDVVLEKTGRPVQIEFGSVEGQAGLAHPVDLDVQNFLQVVVDYISVELHLKSPHFRYYTAPDGACQETSMNNIGLKPVRMGK